MKKLIMLLVCACTFMFTNAQIVVNVPTFVAFNPGSISGSDTICDQSPFSGLSQIPAIGGTNNFTYQWQDSIPNGTWTNINGANQASLNLPATFPTIGNTPLLKYYKRNVIDGECGASTTNKVNILIYPQPVMVASTPTLNCAQDVLTIPITITNGGPDWTAWMSQTNDINATRIGAITSGNSIVIDVTPDVSGNTFYGFISNTYCNNVVP